MLVCLCTWQYPIQGSAEYDTDPIINKLTRWSNFRAGDNADIQALRRECELRARARRLSQHVQLLGPARS